MHDVDVVLVANPPVVQLLPRILQLVHICLGQTISVLLQLADEGVHHCLVRAALLPKRRDPVVKQGDNGSQLLRKGRKVRHLAVLPSVCGAGDDGVVVLQLQGDLALCVILRQLLRQLCARKSAHPFLEPHIIRVCHQAAVVQQQTVRAAEGVGKGLHGLPHKVPCRRPSGGGCLQGCPPVLAAVLDARPLLRYGYINNLLEFVLGGAQRMALLLKQGMPYELLGTNRLQQLQKIHAIRI
mmetsp:Transcript_20019/g.60505  ORF Transcript_20019/g.60505 Transcript_20019/m.60505 type:complete len:240 (+) Transcript_20019:2854-3573(+)